MAGDGVLGCFFGCGLLFRRLFLDEFGMVPKRISDEFAALPISRQRRYLFTFMNQVPFLAR
jgi:hypothetical protein